MRKSDPNLNNSTTQKGVITHTLGNLITVWPLNLNQEKEIVFNDFPTISSQTLHVGDWIQMEVDSGDIIVYREKISPILPTYVSARGDVRVKTQLYFPNGLVTRGKNLIAYSDDFGPIGIFFPCPEIDAKFSYDVWVTR
ncbi:unnamed protein product [Thelazia callipaeda]|uniref:Phage protein n=1 Tax=Thelazia callipaeda TaxID=103827 RepID=A0A0N5CK04_THECL|nr:unnamed protein product [Thelazia callipaeda]